jgi:hypothetical protein
MKPRLRWNQALTRVFSGVALLTALGGLFAAGSEPKRSFSAENKYIGAEKCKSCHGAAESGDQYSHWKEMDHAKAYEALASEEAKKIAAEKGIADPQKSDDCVKCHVTAFGVPEAEIKKGFDRAQGVQCETCHGPGEKHMKARFAEAAKGAAQGYVEIPADEIIVAPAQDKCLECHNAESPTFKRFCYHEFMAKVRHVNPKKPREAGSLLVCGCGTCACVEGCPDDGCGVREGEKKGQ